MNTYHITSTLDMTPSSLLLLAPFHLEHLSTTTRAQPPLFPPTTRTILSSNTCAIQGDRASWDAYTNDPTGELMPAIGRLEDILLHGHSEAIAVVLRRCDGWFILTPVLDPGFELLVPGVGSYAICKSLLSTFIPSLQRRGPKRMGSHR